MNTPVPEPRDRARVERRVLERAPCRLQQQPLLGVHEGRLARGDGEELVVEGVGIVEESAPPGVRLARPAVGVEVVIGPPAVGGHVGDAVLAAQQQLPERVGVGRLREPAVEPDDRDVVHAGYSRAAVSVQMKAAISATVG